MKRLLILIAIAWQGTVLAELPEVTLEYETHVFSGKAKSARTWRFDRAGNTVAHHAADISKRWTRISSREISLEQVYPAEKVIIEFAQGDLKASGAATDWNALTHIIDTNLLSRLKVKRTTKALGQPAVVYAGEIDGAAWRIIWIKGWQAPALISRKDHHGRMVTELRRKVARTSLALESAFARIDYADVGDMESDERLQRILRQDSSMTAHRH